MCKKSIDDSVAESCDCSNPDYPWTVDAEPKNTIEEVYELFNGNPTIGAMLEVYDDELDQVAPLIFSLTNDVLPLFDEQNVCVARRRDDAEAVALEVVVRARRERQFVLAAVARACVDVPHGEAASARQRRQADVTAEAAEISQQRQHQRSAQA